MAAAVCVLLEALRPHPHLQRLSLALSVDSGQLRAPDPAPALAAPDVEVRGCCMAAAMHRAHWSSTLSRGACSCGGKGPL